MEGLCFYTESCSSMSSREDAIEQVGVSRFPLDMILNARNGI